ncbi:hypothetical protein [Campylobacter jejuni]|uniref:hypothetical protein n=1 Tax=Campylobacter jejuni TaxID=197 RepID=UPI001930E3AF|nr:hypothetical protein [Campylobacter jejuni]
MVKASGVAIVPDGIEFSEETNEFWDEITKDCGVITLTYRQDDFLIDYILKITESEIIQTTELVYLDLYLKDENSDCAKTINENTELELSEKKALEKIEQFDVVKFLWR